MKVLTVDRVDDRRRQKRHTIDNVVIPSTDGSYRQAMSSGAVAIPESDVLSYKVSNDAARASS